MVKLNVGCGVYLAPGYINVDKYFNEESLKEDKDIFGNPYEKAEKKGKFVQGDVLKLPFKNNYADVIESSQVFEHLAIQDQVPAFKEVYRVLKKGGKFMFNVPSFNGLCSEWIAEQLRNPEFNPQHYYERAQEFYGMQISEGEYHRCPMTPEWISYCLGQAGFKKVKRMVLFGKERPMPKQSDKQWGLLATAPRRYGDDTLFRHEVIFCEVIK